MTRVCPWYITITCHSVSSPFYVFCVRGRFLFFFGSHVLRKLHIALFCRRAHATKRRTDRRHRVVESIYPVLVMLEFECGANSDTSVASHHTLDLCKHPRGMLIACTRLSVPHRLVVGETQYQLFVCILWSMTCDILIVLPTQHFHLSDPDWSPV